MSVRQELPPGTVHIDSHCPNVFVLRPLASSVWKEVLRGGKVELQLYCQAPGEWHPTEEGGRYTIDNPAKWLRRLGPYIQNLVSLLKFVSPFIGPWMAIAAPEYEVLVRQDIKFMQELIKVMPELPTHGDLNLVEAVGESPGAIRVGGAALRAIRQLLDDKDPNQHWGGLKKVLTPEGHYLWLCDYHARAYEW